MAVQRISLPGTGLISARRAHMPARKSENRLVLRGQNHAVRAANAVAVRTLRDPMTLATLSALFLVSILSFYITAYATLTADSFRLSGLKAEYAAVRRENEALRAEVSRLSLPGAVHAGAKRLGMTRPTADALHILSPVSSRTQAADGTRIVVSNER